MIHLLDIVKNAHRVAIAGHVRPDGDCAGSCLALYRYLQQNTSAEVSLYLERLQDPGNVGRALEMFPLAYALCCADMEAAFLMEGKLAGEEKKQ